MRIISGKYKGRKLVAPKKLPVRPTTDMAKEALFNMLYNRYEFDEISVCDLFAGTGNISFEFASRGTKRVTSVDQHAGCILYINKIDNELNLNLTIIKSDVFRFLDKTHQTFDVIFADPPYDIGQEEFQKLVLLILEKKMLKDGGLLIVEHSSQTDLSAMPHFELLKKYGSNCFSFFSDTVEESI
ncbi:RsmD family RNA methyltransferase [Namhaeicola litoreus]|uniref:RsmD family RNA methyltransferase n=1 Tax=Namhaeicola litoreus TaxID=1052145 RepID=A0ABW3Y737_9FLAO